MRFVLLYFAVWFDITKEAATFSLFRLTRSPRFPTNTKDSNVIATIGVTSILSSLPSSEASDMESFQPAFDFSNAENKAISNFERLDDAIMGGISTSSLNQKPEEKFARWSGVCRLDGGGFCGFRTLPFKEPFYVGDAAGIYLVCQLSSDREPERRVWKATLKTDSSRGEQLYQSAFEIPHHSEGEWVRIKIPFSDFTLVRGPRMIADAPPIDTSGGLFQLGFLMSKFKMGKNMTEIENFRAGFFELQIREIGLFRNATNAASDAEMVCPQTLSTEEARRRKALFTKLLLPVSKLVMTEQSQRRKSAMRILRKRGFSKFNAIMFGVKIRARKYGLVKSTAQSFAILLLESLRYILFTAISCCVVYPMIFVNKLLRYAGISSFISNRE